MRTYDLTTIAGRQSAVNALNDRQKQIGEAFGYDSYYYQDYHSKLELLSGGNLTPSGNMSKSRAAVESLDPDDLQAALDAETMGQTKRKIKENIGREEDKDPEDVTDDEIEQYVDNVTEARNAMTELGSALSDAIETWRQAHGRSGPGGGKMTYAEIKEACDQYDASQADKQNRAEKIYQQHFGNDHGSVTRIESPHGSNFKAEI